MTNSQFDLAIVGADDPLGEALLRVLEENETPIGRLVPVSLDEETESSVTWRRSDWPCEPLSGFDPATVQAVVVANGSEAVARRLREWRQALPHKPMLGPLDVTPAPVLVLGRLLKGIKALGGVESADAFLTLPVSLAGKAGVDELATQSRALFNMESPDPECFPAQVAFNILPQGLMLNDAWLERCEQALPGLRLSALWAPVFYGASGVLHVRTERPIALTALREALSRADGITLMESDLAAGLPTPATDALDSDNVFVGRIQVSDRDLKLWLVFDPLRLEASQMAGSVENWIEKPSDSVLT